MKSYCRNECPELGSEIFCPQPSRLEQALDYAALGVGVVYGIVTALGEATTQPRLRAVEAANELITPVQLRRRGTKAEITACIELHQQFDALPNPS